MQQVQKRRKHLCRRKNESTGGPEKSPKKAERSFCRIGGAHERYVHHLAATHSFAHSGNAPQVPERGYTERVSHLSSDHTEWWPKPVCCVIFVELYFARPPSRLLCMLQTKSGTLAPWLFVSTPDWTSTYMRTRCTYNPPSTFRTSHNITRRQKLVKYLHGERPPWPGTYLRGARTQKSQLQISTYKIPPPQQQRTSRPLRRV